MHEQTVSPAAAARQCLTTVDARSFARNHYRIGLMNQIHEHCNGCERCANLVAAAVAERAAEIAA